MNNKSIFLKIFLPLLFFVSVFYIFTPSFVLTAPSSIREEAFGQLYSAAGDNGAGFGAYKDPRETVARTIRVALELIGAVFLILTVYAGFLWMTAAGAEEQVAKATGILKMAVIGLIIILAAYSLTNFVVYRLVRSTTGGSSDPLMNDFCIKNPDDEACVVSF